MTALSVSFGGGEETQPHPLGELDLLVALPGRDGLGDGPGKRFDEPGVAGVADEFGSLVDGFGEVVGQSQQDALGHNPMVAPLISASESDSMNAMTTKRVTRRVWFAAETKKAEQAAELYGVLNPEPPAPGLVLVGWLWDHSDGSYGLVKPGENVGHRYQPTALRPVWAVPS